MKQEGQDTCGVFPIAKNKGEGPCTCGAYPVAQITSTPGRTKFCLLRVVARDKILVGFIRAQ